MKPKEIIMSMDEFLKGAKESQVFQEVRKATEVEGARPRPNGGIIFANDAFTPPSALLPADPVTPQLTAFALAVRRQALFDAAVEVESHWNEASALVNQREQALRSAKVLRGMAESIKTVAT